MHGNRRTSARRHQHSVDLGHKRLSETGLLVVLPDAGVEEFRLGFRPKDKAGWHAPPASFRRTSSQGMAEPGFVTFCQAAIQFGLLVGSEGESGLAFDLCQALPQGHRDLNALVGRESEKLGNCV